MKKLLLALYFICFSYGNVVYAQPTLPQYDGVYIFDDSAGNWTELNAAKAIPVFMGNSPSDYRDRFRKFGVLNKYYLLHGFSLDDIDAATSHQGDLRILIKSRDWKFHFVDTIVGIGDLASTVGEAIQIDAAIPNFGGRVDQDIAGTIEAVSGYTIPSFVMAGRGWSEQDARVRTIDQFTQELYFPGDRWGGFVQGLSENCRAATCLVKYSGLVIQLMPRERLFVRSDDYEAKGRYYLLVPPDRTKDF